MFTPAPTSPVSPTTVPPSAPMTPRLLTAAEAQVFRQLRAEMLQDTPSAFTASAEDEAGLSDEEWAARVGPGDNTAVMGVFDGDRLVASAAVFRERALKMCHKATIWGVYVSPSVRGKGLAKALIVAALQHAAQWPGVRQVCLSVAGNNVSAHSLYTSLGFVEFAHEPDAVCINGQFIDEKQMVKFLASRL